MRSATHPTAHDQGELTSYAVRDGEELHLRRFLAEQPRAAVVCLHGIISHAGWYTACAAALRDRQFDVHLLDRRGSGLNGESRGDVDQWSDWVRDVVVYLEQLPADLPRVLLGISWGGKLAPVIARQRPDLLDGMGLICPGIYAHQQPNFVKRFGVGIGHRIGFRNKRVWVPLRDPDLFTDAPDMREYIRHDPLTLREITLRFAREDHRMTRFSRKSASYVRTPSLLVLAGRDRIVHNEKTLRYFGRIPSESKTILEYPSAAHTLEFEPDPLPFFEDLSTWIHQTARRSRRLVQRSAHSVAPIERLSLIGS